MALSPLSPSIPIHPVSYPSLASTGELLSGSWQFYQRHLAVLVGVALVPTAASLILLSLGRSPAPVVLIMVLLSVVATLLGRLAFIETVMTEVPLSGGVTQAYQHAVARFASFLWISILGGIAILGGLYLFLVPGILLSVWLSFPAYALVSEGKTGIAALVASWQTVRGHWISVAWRFIAFGLVIAAAGMLLGMLAGWGASISFAHPDITPETVASLFEILFFNMIALPLGIIFSWRLWQNLRQVSAPSQPRAAGRLSRRLLLLIAIGVAGTILIIAFSRPKLPETARAIWTHPAMPHAAAALFAGAPAADIFMTVR